MSAGTLRGRNAKYGNSIHGPTAFEGATNLVFRDTQVITTGGDYINNVTVNLQNSMINSDNPTMRFLLSHCAIEATHDSETAAYAPRCKEGTRTDILHSIMGFVFSGFQSATTLWLSGPAGGGKTCIQREVVKRCMDRGVLAASYFFSTRVEGLDSTRPFATTIALQLSSTIPGLQTLIESAIAGNPSLFSKSLEFQFSKLIAEPLVQLVSQKQAASSPRSRRRLASSDEPEPVSPGQIRVIVIDGLDECQNPEDQIRIVRLLCTILPQHHTLRFKIILASRPEYDIRSTFENPDIKIVTTRIRLEDHNCDTDIEYYLIDSLFEIRATHPSASSLPLDWPSKDAVKQLVANASGQFIYASTFVTFIKNPRRNLMETYKLAMSFHISPSPSGPNPFTHLDSLYTAILKSTWVDLSLLKSLLHGIIVMKSDTPLPELLGGVSASMLDDFYCLSRGTSEAYLCDLHSLVGVPTQGLRTIRFHHKSLEDYLLSPERSGKYHQSPYTTHQQMLKLCCKHLQRWYIGNHNRVRLCGDQAINHAASFWMLHAHTMLDTNGAAAEKLITGDDYAVMPQASLTYACMELQVPHEGLKSMVDQMEQFRTQLHDHSCIRQGRCLSLCQNIRRVHQIGNKIDDFFWDQHPRLAGSWDRYGPAIQPLAIFRRVRFLLYLPDKDWKLYCTGW
ncbi:hypothetical protein FA15DRAFT_669792 [Coprinopsis marcescibilis]|uniref:Nephrocystin 3-like N-terminal domain-containing protein n=1 Tax=Coprinopsis marcescibilis TaxID=230819 RepID=A0A5C3KUC9_COPMA|nr:hypothetical protein FA15DRAFT_669792 [Coprinopsis marcescibilis]